MPVGAESVRIQMILRGTGWHSWGVGPCQAVVTGLGGGSRADSWPWNGLAWVALGGILTSHTM